MTLFKWSRTASADATADSTINWAEGQAPSSINDSARAMMAATAKFRDDISGAIVTGGTSTAYTVASYQGFDTLAHLDGQMIAFTPHATNGATVTLNVDSLGAKPLRAAPSVELQSNALILGTPYIALYNNSDGVFYLNGMGSNAYGIPLAAGMDFWGTTTPSSAFAFPIGQAISRTTYASLFTIMGTTYGSGDGSTTFNLPDKTERVSVMKASTATRLTSTYFGGDSTALGAVGGSDRKTLVTANLPPYTPSGSITNGAITNTVSGAPYAGTSTGGGYTSGGFTSTLGAAAIVVTSSQATSTFTGTAQGGTSTPCAIVQPTIVCNYIIRVI